MRVSAATSRLIGLGALAFAASAALAQSVPAPALDSPPVPLAGPPPNQPPRQLPGEMDASSDPAMSNASRPAVKPGLSKVQKACARQHAGYNPDTQSYVDAAGRQKSCG